MRWNRRKKRSQMLPEKKQRLRLFIEELVMFAILFATLGAVVYFFFQQSVYRNIDQGLQGTKTRILENTPQVPFENNSDDNRKPKPPVADAPFRADTIVFNNQGEIINADDLGTRNYNLLKHSTLNKDELNKITDLTLTAGDISSHFRSLLIKVPESNGNLMYRGNYVLILENVDADLLAINSFQKALLITLVFFWILAIAIAYFLSRSSMRPIIASWRRQRDFSSNAAHELRTPLTVIQNQMEYLLTKPKSRIMDEVDEISISLDEVKHMQNLTNRLLMLARSDSGAIQIDLQSVELQEWFSEILKPYQEIAASQEKSLIMDVNASGSGNLDIELIHQLLTILLENAIKYTPVNGVINILVTRIHNTLKIEVADTGPGIPDSDKKLIFDRFYRTDKSRNSKTGGNGLGLAIAHWIVMQHHGQITVYDNQPKGALFVVEFPVD